MNLQERLERMLEERRGYVNAGLSGQAQSDLLHEGLGNLLERGLYAQGMQPEEVREQHEALTQLAGAILFLLHPEDDLAHVTVDSLALPAPRSQVGLGGAGAQAYFEAHEVPFTVVPRSGGRHKRKPRPDRV